MSSATISAGATSSAKQQASAPLTPLSTSSGIMSAVPPTLRSPLPSELPRTPISASFSLIPPPTPGVDPAAKTPITPPAAYMDFLRNAPSDLKSPRLGGGSASAGPSSPALSPYFQGRRFRASVSGPSSGGEGGIGIQSPGIHKKDCYTPTQSSGLTWSASSSTASLASSSSSTGSGASEGSGSGSASASAAASSPSEPTMMDVDALPEIRTPKSAARRLAARYAWGVTTRSPKSVEAPAEVKAKGKLKRVDKQAEKEKEAMKEYCAERDEDDKVMVEQGVEQEEDEDEDEPEALDDVDCVRRKSAVASGPKEGMVTTIKQVVANTVTFKPRMSLMPAPKGKKRKIE